MDKQVWERLTSNFWLDTKIPVSNDLPSWRKMTSEEQTLIKKVFGSLTALDTLQSEVGAPTLARHASTDHERAVYNNIAFMESVHAKSYSTIFSTLCSGGEIEEIFRWVQDNDKLQRIVNIIQDYYKQGSVNEIHGASVFLESMLFYTGFYAPLRFAAEGYLTNTADIIRLILRDEGVHGYYIGYKYQQRQPNKAEHKQVLELVETLLDIEMQRVEELYDPLGWTEEVKGFLRYNANKALVNLGYGPMFTPEESRVPSYILAALDPGTGEAHDFFSGSGASYVMGKTEETTEEDWEW